LAEHPYATFASSDHLSRTKAKQAQFKTQPGNTMNKPAANLTLNHPTAADLSRIMQIERAGFTAAEAASEAAMDERIRTINDTFIVARDASGTVIGFIVAAIISERYLHDELFAKSVPNPPHGGYCAILSLAVAPEQRGQGIAGQLLQALIATCRIARRDGITLTCLDALIPFYEKNGFTNEGISASQHAGEQWFNLVQDLPAAEAHG